MSKPLYQKLGIKPEHRVALVNVPSAYLEWLDCDFSLNETEPLYDFVHIFSDTKADLETWIKEYKGLIEQDGMIWISWPKKSSKVPTDIIEDTIRDIVLPMGLVDVKVCSVSDIWSALKVVIRKELRTKT